MITSSDKSDLGILVFLHIIFSNLNGVLNAFLYGYTKSVKKFIKDKLGL